MKRKPLDVAREFCELTGAADLLSYLELDAGASTDEAVVALTARRRRLQGMQGNPKYKAEALFLIRNFASLEDALADPAAHAEAMAESPDTGYARIFEATLRSLLAAGAILPAQREHLERNAADFEIGPAAFREMLSRLSVEAGRPGLPPVPSSRAESSTSGRGLVARDALNHYQVLGAERFATFEDIRRTYHARATEAGQYADPTEGEAFIARLDQAWEVLSDPAKRATYDQAVGATGPPARIRGAVDPLADTAPPVRSRSPIPPRQGRPPRLALSGCNQHDVAPGDILEVMVRNSGGQVLEAEVTSPAPWVRVYPIVFRIDGGDSTLVQITVGDRESIHQSEHAEVRIRAGEQEVVISLDVTPLKAEVWRWGVAVLAGVVPVLVVAALVLTYEARRLEAERPAEPLSGVLVIPELPQPKATPTAAPEADRDLAPPPPGALRVRVRPRAEAILVNGVVVGSGDEVLLARPPVGDVQIVARHRNFRTFNQLVQLGEEGLDLDLELALERRLDFAPRPEMTRGSVSLQKGEAALGAIAGSLDACIRRGSLAGSFLAGTITVHVDVLGRAIGMDVEGDRAGEPQVMTCLEREVATLMLGDLGEGDYATLRYDYTVSAGEDPR